MQVALSLDATYGRSLQERLFGELRGMILDGRLRPADMLPPSRELAAQLGVSRNTVLLAYERLRAEGYVESRRNVGMFVCSGLPENALFAADEGKAQPAAAATPVAPSLPVPPVQNVVAVDQGTLEVDFWVGRPDPRSFPRAIWRQLLDEKLSCATSALTEYQDPQGILSLRQAIVEHVGPTRGIAATPDDVVIVSGSQDGLNLLTRMLARHRRVLVHEDPCYQGALYVFVNEGLQSVPVPVDDQGLDVTRLPDLREAIVYVTPSHQYPTGVTLPLERRQQLLAWAERTDSLIVEDDYDGDFRYEGAPLLALRALDRSHRVLYLATFSKAVGAGLRLGYLIVPPGLRAPARAWKTLMSIGTPWLEQAVMAEFMRCGAFERHLRRIRACYVQRRDRLVGALQRHFGSVEILGRDAGMHLCWRRPRGLPDAPEIERLARQARIGLYTVTSGGAWASPHNPLIAQLLVLGYAAIPEHAIDRAVSRLADVVTESAQLRLAGPLAHTDR